MKQIVLVFCALGLLFLACSKNNPASAPATSPPPGGSDTTHKHDTIPVLHDTTPKPPPPAETPGKSVVVSMYSMTIFLDNSKEYDGWSIGYYVRLMDKDTSHYSAELINASRGTCKIDYTDNPDSDVVFTFSNVYHSPDGSNAALSDSAGNIQLHVYRKDGKNIKAG